MKHVYLIQLEGTNIYKIGYTKSNPQKRIESLQTGNPFKLILIDSYTTKRATKVEAALHNRYRINKVDEDEYKLLGEWFQFDNNMVKNFKSTCELIDNNFKIIEEMSTLDN
jgi:transcriptional regulator of heat shock response